MEALLTIASRSSGQIKVNEAKKIMVEAELIKTPKNAASIVYTLIDRSGKFEWIASGEYKLIGSQPSLPSIS